MIEAELAVRGVSQCNLGKYGQVSLSTFGPNTYERTVFQSNSVAATDYDCTDLSSGAAEQKFFLASNGPISDPHNLDGDGEGLVCEWGTQIKRISQYRRPPAIVRTSASQYPTGPKGGTYTITSSGNKKYAGC